MSAAVYSPGDLEARHEILLWEVNEAGIALDRLTNSLLSAAFDSIPSTSPISHWIFILPESPTAAITSAGCIT